jgi:UDP:flavonoid glycosyltransferase YjiC (YdhE family)
MRIALLTIGSRGDTQPYVAVGHELLRRGHSVVVTATEDLVPLVTAAGLEAVPYAGVRMRDVADSDEGKRLLARGDLLRFLRLYREKQKTWSDALLDGLLRGVEGADAIVSHPLAEIAGQTFFRTRGIQHIRTVLTPVVPTSAFSAPLLTDGRFPVFRRATHLLVAAMAWQAEKRAHRIGCARLGIEPERTNPHTAMSRTGVPAAVLISPTLVPRPDDWPASHVQTGYPGLCPELREKLGERGIAKDLDAWLSAGSAPVYLGFGSMPIFDPAGFMQMVRGVLRKRGQRGLVVAGWSRLDGFEASDDVLVARAVDHDAVLPRCTMAVHHGGLGTTTAVLAAGIPALVCPMLADQSFWGARVELLGAGVSLPFRKLDAARLDRAIERLSQDDVRERVRALAEKMRSENGAVATANFVERAALSKAH